jgi:hypothetical protein
MIRRTRPSPTYVTDPPAAAAHAWAVCAQA